MPSVYQQVIENLYAADLTDGLDVQERAMLADLQHEYRAFIEYVRAKAPRNKASRNALTPHDAALFMIELSFDRAVAAIRNDTPAGEADEYEWPDVPPNDRSTEGT